MKSPVLPIRIPMQRCACPRSFLRKQLERCCFSLLVHAASLQKISRSMTHIAIIIGLPSLLPVHTHGSYSLSSRLKRRRSASCLWFQTRLNCFKPYNALFSLHIIVFRLSSVNLSFNRCFLGGQVVTTGRRTIDQINGCRHSPCPESFR